MKNYNSSVNQEIKSKFVNREVYSCVSFLVHELSQKEEYLDELGPVLSQDNWESAALDFLDSTTKGQLLENIDFGGKDYSYATLKGLKRVIRKEIDYQDFCECFNLEPCVTEAYEHWIVSEYLANKLEEHGEMIIYDFLGLTIWGRACAGQSIKLDHVISEICDDLGILQENRA